jgi:hypothetical protein
MSSIMLRQMQKYRNVIAVQGEHMRVQYEGEGCQREMLFVNMTLQGVEEAMGFANFGSIAKRVSRIARESW